MALISSTLLLRGLSLYHLAVAYYLLTSPSTLLTSNVVMMLGGSMQIADPPSSAFPFTSTTATSLAALFAIYLSLADFVATTLPAFAYDEHWSAQILVRVTALFGLVGWIYFKGSEAGKGALGAGYGLKNSVVFSLGFVELLVLFWVFVTLRDERRELAVKVKAERDMRSGK